MSTRITIAHAGCDACSSAAQRALAYIAAGGIPGAGKFRSAVVEGGPHWAVYNSSLEEAAEERGDDRVADSAEVAPLLDVVAAAAGNASAIVRCLDEAEGQGMRPLSKLDRAAVELVEAAWTVLAERTGLRQSQDHARRAATFEVAGTRARGDEDPDFLSLGAGDRDPAAAGAERREDVVFGSADVGLRDHDPFAVDHELMVGHDASPSAGESAEPRQASTVSVGGEPVAGGPNPGTPAARAALAENLAAETSPAEEDRSRSAARRSASLEGIDDVLKVRDGHAPEFLEVLLEALDEPVGRLEFIASVASHLERKVRRREDHAGCFSRTIVVSMDDDHANGAVFAEKLRDCLVDREAGSGEDASVEHEIDVAEPEDGLHDASPSAGECAEPGLASTVSVEGEPAAGGPNAWTPAASSPAEHGREINPAALRSIRELAGVRSDALARASGISHGFLSNVEAGREQPSPTVIRQLARRLGVPVDAITQTV